MVKEDISLGCPDSHRNTMVHMQSYNVTFQNYILFLFQTSVAFSHNILALKLIHSFKVFNLQHKNICSNPVCHLTHLTAVRRIQFFPLDFQILCDLCCENSRSFLFIHFSQEPKHVNQPDFRIKLNFFKAS